MRLAMRLPEQTKGDKPANDVDPRDEQPAEVIDLASRNAYPSVTQRKGASDGWSLFAGVALVVGLGAISFWAMNNARNSQPDEEVVQQQAVPAQPTRQAATVPATQPVKTPVNRPVSTGQPVRSSGSPAPAPRPVYAARPSTNAAPVGNPYATPTIVFDAGGAPLGKVAVPADAITGEGRKPVAGGGPATAFANRIGGVGGGPAQATAMVNPQTTVTQGTLIPAVLETAIDTNVPGYVRAVVSQDVRSFDGRRVLVPRSSRLIGQYQSGLQNGQKRAYVIWTRLIRPDGASVNLASPAVGFDGSTGLRGKVKSNFFERFGSAMLLSVVGGLSAIGTGGASVVLGGTGQAAAAAVNQNGNIGPTVRVPMGAPIRVFTARDLDFTGVS